MRITGWHVDGYGRFHDRGWDGLPAGLTVFHGPNEAGKSTLLSFLRSMLFGLRDGRTSDPAIPALAGGRHGGVLRVADELGAAWAIERHGRDLRVLDGDGTPHDALALGRLLGGVNRDVFEAVFAFGLTELEALGGLDEDALRDQLFAASLTGGGSSAHEALATLGRRVDGLYRPRGDSPLKTLDERLKALRAERRTALAGQEAYATLRAREADAADTIASLETRLRDGRLEQDRLARLARVWTLVDPLDRRRAALAGLAAGPTVRPSDVTDARDADRAAAAAREQLDEVAARRRTTADALAELQVDPGLLSAAEPLRALDREATAQRERLLARSGLRTAAGRLADEARGAVADLGPGWDVDEVLALDASLPARREAGRRATAVAAADDAVTGAETRAEEADRRVRGARGEVDRREQAVGGLTDRRARGVQGEVDRREQAVSGLTVGRARDPRTPAGQPGQPWQPGDAASSPDDLRGGAGNLPTGDDRSPAAADLPTPEGLDHASAALSEVRGALQDLLVRRGALRSEVAVLEELRGRAARPVRSTVPKDDRTRVSVLLLVAVLSVLAGIAIAALGQPLGGGALVLVGLVVGWADRTGAGDDADAVADREAAAAEAAAQEEEHADRVRRQEGRVATEREAVAALERTVREASPVAGLDPEEAAAATSTALVERRAGELDRLRDRRRAADVAERDLAAAQEDARVAAREADEAREAVAAARAAAREAGDAWRTWSTGPGLPDALRAEDAVALLAALERAQDAVRAAADASSAVEEADRALTTWSRRAATTLADAGRAPADALDVSAATGSTAPGDLAHDHDHDALLLAVADAHAAAQAAVAAQAQRTALLERDAEDADEADRLAARVATHATRRDEVLAAAGAADLPALEQACADTDRRAALEVAVREGDEVVRAEAGGGRDGDALIAEARTGAVTVWAARREELEAALPALDDERTRAIAARTDATRDRQALEASVDLPRIDGEIEAVRADAARLLTELRTTVRARELISGTLDAFVRDRQPTVLRDASAWFARITDGRYTDVRQTLQERRGKQTPVLQVVPAHGVALDPATLSRGTREQLYLALRLALVGRTARDATPLPLVMDDVLVNFSPDRSGAVAEVVAEVARTHQVLFFTCHPATRDLLVGAGGGDVRVEELTRG